MKNNNLIKLLNQKKFNDFNKTIKKYTEENNYYEKNIEKNNYYEKINFIDKILWINLDKSNQRNNYMTSILKNINIPNIRIPAIDGKMEDIMKYINIVDFKFKCGNYCITNIEIACTLSHLKAINELKNIEGNYFLILEDDISFENMKYIPYDLETIIKDSPEFDVLQICKTIMDHKNFNLIKDKYEKWNHMYNCTGAYIISRNGINKIIEKYNFKNNVLQNKLSEINDSDSLIYECCNAYTYKYNVISTLDEESTIHSNHLKGHRRNTIIQKNIIFKDFYIV